MGICLTSMNCNDKENTRYFDTRANVVEFEPIQINKYRQEKDVNKQNESNF